MGEYRAPRAPRQHRHSQK